MPPNWRRSQWLDETGLPWVNPSPNLRSLAALKSYPGSVYFEGTNLTEGRGTDRPFEQIGAPWLNAAQVAASMNERRLPGIRFEAITMPVAPTAAKFNGQTIPAIRFVVTDRAGLPACAHVALLIDEIRRQHPRDSRGAEPSIGSPARTRCGSRSKRAGCRRCSTSGTRSGGVLGEPETFSALSLIARRLSTLLEGPFERLGGFQVRVHGRVDIGRELIDPHRRRIVALVRKKGDGPAATVVLPFISTFHCSSVFLSIRGSSWSIRSLWPSTIALAYSRSKSAPTAWRACPADPCACPRAGLEVRL